MESIYWRACRKNFGMQEYVRGTLLRDIGGTKNRNCRRNSMRIGGTTLTGTHAALGSPPMNCYRACKQRARLRDDPCLGASVVRFSPGLWAASMLLGVG